MKIVSQILVLIFLVLTGCKGEKKYHDVKTKNALVQKDKRITDILEFQNTLNLEFKDSETSPLPDRFRKDFESLEFFAPDTNYIVRAKFNRTPDAVPFLMPTTTDRESEEVVYGTVHFSLNDNNYTLEIYQNPELVLQEKYKNYLFLPFTDKTNGYMTYDGGRYLDLEIPQGDVIVLDFNKAYNPYCAYNKKYSCPLVPPVNHIETKISAGVKSFKPNG
ncbi:DUF1684 domain-containing protein [Maribacter sp. 2304DJ31-5]|uniref:DUF1684 domain-containing protein n=1 Tax=Maribacter sp. 2304DJ31-5 TaxID=3386273 RepID=UPI0039BCD3F0